MMLRYLPVSMLALAGSSLVVGCGDDSRPPTDGGLGDAICIGCTDGARPDGGGRDGGGGGDGNDSFADAVTIPIGPEGVMERIQTPGDEDYFSFMATAGTWYVLSTDANPDDDPDMIDTVITLYDDTMTQLAENDDGVPRASTDSEIIWVAPADGTYYVKVQEWSEWAGETLEGMPSFTYTLSVLDLDGTEAAVLIDAEPGNDAASATALKINMDVGFLFGTFASASDIDVFSFSVAAGRTFFFDLMPSGTSGYGSTSPAGRVYVTSSDGSEVLARIDNSLDNLTDISPALTAGDYLLWIEHGSGAAGANDFYVVKALGGMDNPPEAEEATNGTLAGAEALAQMTDDTTGITSAFLLAQLPDNSDVDYYSYDVAAGEQLSVACGAATSGSGVRGLTVEVRDASDAVLTMQAETLTDDVFIEDAMTTGAGTYYIRLSKTGQDAEVTSTWVRCGIRSGVPAAP